MGHLLSFLDTLRKIPEQFLHDVVDTFVLEDGVLSMLHRVEIVEMFLKQVRAIIAGNIYCSIFLLSNDMVKEL